MCADRRRQRREDETFRRAIERFERAAETPLVPGELERWIAEVDESFADLERLLPERIESVHRGDLAEIERQDPGLIRRSEELKETDRQTLERLSAIRSEIDELSQGIADVEPDEAQLSERFSNFVERALDFVIHVRRQETALETWLLEAFDRDRGRVD